MLYGSKPCQVLNQLRLKYKQFIDALDRKSLTYICDKKFKRQTISYRYCGSVKVRQICSYVYKKKSVTKRGARSKKTKIAVRNVKTFFMVVYSRVALEKAALSDNAVRKIESARLVLIDTKYEQI
ncbi:hypothetical protein MAH1_31190 [Sessilibacter sp. MAH1]